MMPFLVPADDQHWIVVCLTCDLKHEQVTAVWAREWGLLHERQTGHTVSFLRLRRSAPSEKPKEDNQ
jgi:hypothetical protein